MISKKLVDAINEQINKELFSSYLYLSMVSYFEDKGLPGVAHWLRLQVVEENEHGMKLFDYLVERGARVSLGAIEKPKAEWKSSLDAFKEVLAHEQFITDSINKLYEVALEEKDYASQILLQWFIEEQVEEEANASAILQKLEMIEDKGTAVLMLDKELGKRA
ncbi:ferritin [Chloroflexota bacterium]